MKTFKEKLNENKNSLKDLNKNISLNSKFKGPIKNIGVHSTNPKYLKSILKTGLEGNKHKNVGFTQGTENEVWIWNTNKFSVNDLIADNSEKISFILISYDKKEANEAGNWSVIKRNIRVDEIIGTITN